MQRPVIARGGQLPRKQAGSSAVGGTPRKCLRRSKVARAVEPEIVPVTNTSPLQHEPAETASRIGEEPSTSAHVSDAVASEHEQRLVGRRVAQLSASKSGKMVFAEQGEEVSVGAYMALPASQYSVLDSDKIERIDDSTFRCHVGGIRFFGFAVEPVLTLSVVVEERGCTIRLLGCKEGKHDWPRRMGWSNAHLQGSKVVEDANAKFIASMTNRVRWSEGETEAEKEISSDGVLNQMVPSFLRQLRRDYEVWAAGGARA